MYIKQRQLENLKKLLKPGKVVVIYGARRTGKTTLLNEYLKTEPEPYLLVSGEDIIIQGYLSSQSIEKLKAFVGIREQFGLSQDKFADLVGISVGTLRNWEQGRRKPEGPARVLLRVASRHPEVLLDIGREQPKRADRTPSRSTGRTKKLRAA